MALLVAVAVLLLLTALVVVVLVRKLTSPAGVLECDPEWLREFSVAKYRPMLRLLDEADYRFLASQAGFDGRMARKLRAERRAIFRAYLRNLIRDFGRLQLMGKFMLLDAQQDRPDLMTALLRQRICFVRAVSVIEVSLVLHSLGLGTVDPRRLLGVLEDLRVQVQQLAPAPSVA
ncbi:MAG: hypothetical protein HYS04_09220 [Acidobacteria bacterium]|nr:hypothetical protein [Acidobacteriota bacterium]